MANTLNNHTLLLTTSESDIFVAPSKSLTLLIQAVNTTASGTQCELWITNGSNEHVACIIPYQEIDAYNGISDTSKHIVPSGYKIRGKAYAGSSIYVEISVVEGV